MTLTHDPATGMTMSRDPATGIVLAHAPLPTTATYRVASSSWGPLNPPQRPASLSEVDSSWARFDTPGGRVVYTGQTRRVSLAEVLAYFQMPAGLTSGLEKDAAYLEMTRQEFAQAVEEEWARQGHMPPGQIARSWRAARLLHTVTLPATGTWVALAQMDTIGAIENELAALLRTRGIDNLTISHLTGEDRIVTVHASTWLRGLTLADGTRPHGIMFPSKHGGGDAYAYWMRHVDDGGDPTGEAITADDGQEILEHDPDVVAVANRFRLRIH